MFVLVSSFLVSAIRHGSQYGISFLTKRTLDNIVDAQNERILIGGTENYKIQEVDRSRRVSDRPQGG